MSSDQHNTSSYLLIFSGTHRFSDHHLFLFYTDDNSESEEYEDSDSESEDPFTSHQARRQTASGSQRGAMAPFYNYPGAGWTPPFSSAPPLPWVTQTHRHTDRQTDTRWWKRRKLLWDPVSLCYCFNICSRGQFGASPSLGLGIKTKKKSRK